MFSSAVVKRHTGLGPGGIDAIYSTPAAGGTSTVAANVGGVGSIPNDATRGLGTTGQPSADHDVYPLVGKAGIGDLAISTDEKELWYTNLFDGNLYRLPIGTPPAVSVGTPVSVGMGTASCTNGTLRPWGVTYYGGKVYVGAICDASGDTVTLGSPTSDLTAHVFVYDPVATTWANALPSFPLDFTRGRADQSQAQSNYWYPWTSALWTTVYPGSADQAVLTLPQPVLSDVEFDVNGVMVLGFLDRLGHQTGRINYDPDQSGPNFLFSGVAGGDILKACWNFSTNAFVLESDGACGVVGAANRASSAGTGNTQGPGGGEFFLKDDTTGLHGENSDGGLALLPGSGTVATTASDVDDTLYTQGVNWFSQSDGTRPSNATIDADTSATGAFGKASGLGDLELLAAAAPTEVGNRVWKDLDSDGRQDAGEPGIPNVVVTLDISGGSTYTATTDSAGQYGFSSRASGTGSGVTYNVPLAGSKSFTVSVPTTVTLSSTTWSLTTRNAAGGSVTDPADAESKVANADRIDSDVDSTTGLSSSFTLSSDGANQHTFDIGYVLTPLNLGNQVWFDLDDDGIKDAGEQPVPGVTVQLFWDGNNDGALTTGGEQTVIDTATTDSQGRYLFTSLMSGASYVVGIPSSNFTGSGALVGYWSSLVSVANDGTISETAAGDPDTDVDDNDDNGEARRSGFYSGGVLSPSVTVTAGAEPTGENPDNNPGGTPDTNSNLTVDFGFYTTALGNQVWLDDGTGGGTADNGLLDGTESGMDSVVVKLFAGDGTTEVPVGPDGKWGTGDDATGGITTVGGGYYQFRGLPAGSYVVAITVPDGYYSSTDPADGGTPFAVESDDNGIGNNGGDVAATVVTMVPGSNTDGNVPTAADGTTANPRVDFGLYATTPNTSAVVAIGDYTWNDLDQDGVQDAGEAPFAGIAVELFNSDGTTPALNANGIAVAPTLTDTNGHYVFDNLLPGAYVAKFTLPAGWVFTMINGGLSGEDSNPSPSATATVGYTPIFTVSGTAGGDTRAVVPGDGVSYATVINPTIDAGVVDVNAIRPPPVTTPLPPTGSIPTTGSDPTGLIVFGVVLVILGRVALRFRRKRPLGATG